MQSVAKQLVKVQEAEEHYQSIKIETCAFWPIFRRFRIIDPLVPKDMFRLVCLVKLVFFAREGVAF